MQLSKKMIKELHEEAQNNALNSKDYLRLLRAVDETINRVVLSSDKPSNDYDVNGKEIE